MITFLKSLDTARIPYVSWKNNHEISGALSGETDLDLFVPLQFRAAFLSAATASAWIRFENPVARYPWVTHFYNLDEELREFHLHVYFKLVTGESWLKEFILPFDEFLLSERFRIGEDGVWGLNKRAQAYLYAVRHLLKGGSFFSRTHYRRELESYREEWEQCEQRVEDLAGWGPIRLDNFLHGSGLQSSPVQLPGFFTALRFRASLSPFLRLPRWSLPFRRIHSLDVRALNKLIFKRKKVFPQGGLVLAISGADGAGKSTMLNEIAGVLSKFISVQRLGLGKPQGAIVEALRKRMKLGEATQSSASPASCSNQSRKKPGLRSSLSAAVLAILRFRMAHKAVRYALKGDLVLVDRWPTDVVGMMDGPRFEVDAAAGFATNLCCRMEHWAYQRMPRANLCFFLQSPESVLVERNRSRVKEDKETDGEIIARNQQNQRFKPLANKVVLFDNDGPLAQKRVDLISAIWNEIGRH